MLEKVLRKQKQQELDKVKEQQAAELALRQKAITDLETDVFTLMLHRKATINDLKLVVNQIVNKTEQVFNSHMIEHFADDDMKRKAGLLPSDPVKTEETKEEAQLEAKTEEPAIA